MIINFTGYDAIIRDEETNETLLQGKVAVYHKAENLIEIDTLPLTDLSQKKMHILLYQSGMAYISHGTFRKVHNIHHTGIALFRGELKADRKNERFPIQINAIITDHLTPTGQKISDIRYRIKILDISRSGIRIEGANLHLKKGEKIMVRFQLKDQFKEYHARIVRVGSRNMESLITEYGCELITRQEYEKLQ